MIKPRIMIAMGVALFALMILASAGSQAGPDQPAEAAAPAKPAAADQPAAAEEQEPDRISGPGISLRFPSQVWTKVFPSDVTGVALAAKTGAAAASTESMVYYFTDDSKPVWTAGEKQGWKHVEGLGLSWDGNRVLFQTDLVPKKHTEAMNLTVHFLDGSGRELWAKPSPYRWETTLLSPSGKFILFGETFHASLKCHDDNMNLLWQKNTQIWYVAFDPLEHFLFDGEGGILFTVKGEQVWDFGPYTRILSVSDDAQYVMTQFYRTVGTQKQVFLIARTALKKIELAGTGAAVSPDGTFMAYVNADERLQVFNTADVVAAGGPPKKPLLSTDFLKPWVIKIARDNRTLFVMGQKSQNLSVMALYDLEKMKKAWEKPVDATLRLALTTEDNRFIVIKPDNRTVIKLQAY